MTENSNLESTKIQIKTNLEDYKDGLKKGFPICLGYISVSITFGILAANGGMSASTAVLISATNLTSAGQFAGLGLIFNTATYFELALTTLVINIRYMLMSLSLSQKLDKEISFLNKLLISFGITDEIFAVASLEEKKLTSQYMFGLITLPFIGWTLGTYIGAVASEFLPVIVQDAFGIAIYGMFIALIIPPSKKSKAIFFVVLLSIFFSCCLYYLPYLNNISQGFAIIIASILSSVLGAYFFPIKEDK
ncbi:AzlC family ABC transporter permease [Clostridioides difficile]